MAHFVELNQNNEVLRVVVVNDDYLKDENGNEVEQLGKSHMESVYGGRWIQTSYNNKIRVRFGRVGYTYDETLDAFIRPKPELHPSWVFNEAIADWEPPIPKPDDGNFYAWNEDTQSWDLVPPPEEPVEVVTE